MTSLALLDKADVQRGLKVLVYGASGIVAAYALQLAKHQGVEVTAVCSGSNFLMARALAADEVMDYTAEDFTERAAVYDVIFDVVGTVKFSKANRALKPGGLYLLANPVSQMLSGLWTRMTSEREVVMQTSSPTVEDLQTVRGLIEAGKLRTVIDREYPLEQIVEAHRYVETGAKQGNVVVTV